MTPLQAMYYFNNAETVTIPSDRSGTVAICVACIFVKRAGELAAIRAGSKIGCVELCNFHFCAQPFLSANEKFDFFGVPRATRQRHLRRVAVGMRMR